MIFIDTSAYLAILLPHDPNQAKARQILQQILNSKGELITSFGVLSEILTVGSMRFDRLLTIKFVEEVISSQTLVIIERQDLLDQAFAIFKNIKNKNVSFVDCYSFAIIKDQKINQAFSFDRDFQKHAGVMILS